MKAGIKIINNFGTVLIDEAYQVLCLKSKTVINTAAPYNFSVAGAKHPQFLYSDIAGDLLIRTYIYWGGLGNNLPIDTAEVRLDACLNLDGTSTHLPVACTAWVFDDSQDSGSTYGLKIYDSTGKVIFDALQKNCRVVGIIEGVGEMVVPPGRKYAIGLLAEAYNWENGVKANSIDPKYASNLYVHHGLRTAVYNTGSVIGTRYGCFEGYVTNSEQYPTVIEKKFGTARAIVVDVTGY
jgi:hypothetical protein